MTAYPTSVHPDIQKEHDKDNEFEFEKRWRIDEKMEDQIGFMRKVFGIVAMQMTVVMIAAMSGSLFKSIRPYTTHPGLTILSFIIVMACAFTIALNVPVRRSVPGNYVILGLLTIGEAFLFAGLTAKM